MLQVELGTSAAHGPFLRRTGSLVQDLPFAVCFYVDSGISTTRPPPLPSFPFLLLPSCRWLVRGARSSCRPRYAFADSGVSTASRLPLLLRCMLW